ncbi:glycine zipper 2TM domain-containing protein [uncultured Ramlibacter sp.]|uniref:glycine zipper 2TM domain-containing protein n=1 Tax=uncultured Ramlibacter sp. TaxID=260755 RepID=UPI0026274856|nr:glycine zipper 2TM domain-containing protein [uncultured Ramlibacter sp.]
MNRIAIASVLALAMGGMAAAQAETFVDNARVRSAEPQYEQVSVPREQCSQQWVNEQRPVQGTGGSGTSIGGALIGGVAGGLLGHQVGKGKGNTAATVLGATVGALAGNHVGSTYGAPQQVETVPRQVTQCHTVQEVQNRLTGYRVAYDYRGQTYNTVMREQPGPNLQVRVSVEPVTH